MKITVNAKPLREATQRCLKAVPGKSSIQILYSFLITVKSGKMSITASDTDTVFVSTMDVAEHDGEGSFCVDAKLFASMVRQMGDIPVVMETRNKEMHIDYFSGEFDIPVTDADVYPVREAEHEDDRVIELPCQRVTEALDKTVYAVGSETIRPQLTGVLWDVKDAEVSWVATDTHKLAVYTTPLTSAFTARFIMTKLAASLIKEMAVKDGSFLISFRDNTVKVVCGEDSLEAKGINGNFPDYNRVIPKNASGSAVIDAGSLVTAIDRCSLTMSQSSSCIVVNLTPQGSEVSATDPDLCRFSKSRFDIDGDCSEIRIGMNATFLKEVVKSCKDKDGRVTARYDNNSKPMLISPAEQPSGAELKAIIMPLQIIE